VKQISEVQKAMGEDLLIVPKFKSVRNIEGGDGTTKCVLLRPEADKDKVEAYVKEKGYSVTQEKVTLGYENLSMSTVINLNQQ
jgi:hypothetical protein